MSCWPYRGSAVGSGVLLEVAQTPSGRLDHVAQQQAGDDDTRSQRGDPPHPVDRKRAVQAGGNQQAGDQADRTAEDREKKLRDVAAEMFAGYPPKK